MELDISEELGIKVLVSPVHLSGQRVGPDRDGGGQHEEAKVVRRLNIFLWLCTDRHRLLANPAVVCIDRPGVICRVRVG